MEVALLGSRGMLGGQIADALRRAGHSVLAPSHAEADLARPLTLEKFFQAHDFPLLINCAAFTRVDACEEAAWHSEAFAVNGVGVGWLAKFCRLQGRTLVHFSTDYVFDGEKEGPYLETDRPAPINAYGRTKKQGEDLILAEKCDFYLIRTSWLYGPGGRNFVTTMLELFKTKPK
ncbi:MAG TPA: NAD(P)-dependent oxidoreductase, partial [bacterium]|nr:NAD(P)-dependent oxidoreductase [bacterium]